MLERHSSRSSSMMPASNWHEMLHALGGGACTSRMSCAEVMFLKQFMCSQSISNRSGTQNARRSKQAASELHARAPERTFFFCIFLR